jgi:hypothetical protein
MSKRRSHYGVYGLLIGLGIGIVKGLISSHQCFTQSGGFCFLPQLDLWYNIIEFTGYGFVLDLLITEIWHHFSKR